MEALVNCAVNRWFTMIRKEYLSWAAKVLPEDTSWANLSLKRCDSILKELASARLLRIVQSGVCVQTVLHHLPTSVSLKLRIPVTGFRYQTRFRPKQKLGASLEPSIGQKISQNIFCDSRWMLIQLELSLPLEGQDVSAHTHTQTHLAAAFTHSRFAR